MNVLVEEIKLIARKAGQEILKVYNDEEVFEISHKSDNSPLTKADEYSNDVIVQGLKNVSVNYPIISEENKQIPYNVRKDYEMFWLVDPLDGTKEFIKRNGEFTVNIALIQNHKPILGVVYVPVTDKMFWAIKNLGAFRVDNGIEKKLIANHFSIAEDHLRVVCSRSHINKETQEYIDLLSDPVLVNVGSSLKFLILAEGGAEIYPRLGPTMEWDTAAAHIILEEAGGSVLRIDTKTSLDYNKENLLNPYFVAKARTIN